MIDKFEKGKYYIFKGNQGKPYFNPLGEMDFILDGKPHKCLFAYHGNSTLFEGDPNPNPFHWAWRIEDFEEYKKPEQLLLDLQ